uniref:Uncharacterized protein n=1 Tax=Oryza sativa subsp. japonica TaxID=39947 RepID=Q6EQ65_ORYSJ|nr:hypothetical protein [Oryza sativa Japonica Group]BAD29205.1 hypothetical protein [Oryza sativa Japonica Group]
MASVVAVEGAAAALWSGLSRGVGSGKTTRGGGRRASRRRRQAHDHSRSLELEVGVSSLEFGVAELKEAEFRIAV